MTNTPPPPPVPPASNPPPASPPVAPNASLPATAGPDWQEVRRLFDEVAGLPAAQRMDFLNAITLDDAVRAEVLSLLAHVTDEAPADAPAASPGAASPASPPPSRSPRDGGPPLQAGQRVGDWTILRPLGSGGMAEVFLAGRADGAFEGVAAIKVLKRGMDSRAVLRRFSLEQNALARLNHPHIARLLDAGHLDDGLPYFVMEHVDGRPIDQACEGLALEDRLRLFVDLADAVAHAHRHLLVHRDLKPSNVLVVPPPPEQVRIGGGPLWGPGEPAPRAVGTVKLLDFGIAKALDTAEGQPAATGAGPRPYTPYYASPEQVRGQPVATGTDIYSLGVLLYVMLTGLRPYGRDATTADAAARSVLEEAPTRPSALSAAASTDPNWVRTRRRLAGDLDNILLKALEKSVERRYPSVEAFAADVRAFLSGYPVSAHAPSAWYVATRFAQRHRGASLLAGFGAVAVLAGLLGTSWQAERATRAQLAAEQRLAEVRGITRDVVLRYSDAVTFLPGGLSVKEDLLKGLLGNLQRLESEAGDDPEWLALLVGAYARLAQVQGNDGGASLDKMPDARGNAEHAIALALRAWPARQHDPAFVASFAEALQIRAQGLRAEGKPAEGLPDLQDAAQRLDKALSAAPVDSRRPLRIQRASVWMVLAQFHEPSGQAGLGQPEQALKLYERAETELKALQVERPEAQIDALLGTLLGARAIIHLRAGRLAPALADGQACLETRLRTVKAEPFNTAWRDGLVTDATNHAVILLRAEQPAKALQASQAAWDEVQALARENGPQSKWATVLPRVAQHHGRVLVLNGQHAAALPVLARAIEMWDDTQRRSPGAHPTRMRAWLTLYQARALAGSGEKESARARMREVLAELTALASQPQARDALLNLGEAQLFMATLEPPRQQAEWRQRALAAYTQAHALQPLTGDHLRNFVSVGGKPAAT